MSVFVRWWHWERDCKFAILGFTCTVALGKSHADGNYYRTELFLGKPENEKPFIATVPLGRGSTPKDVANMCVYLSSEDGAFLTGNAIEVDGGRCV